MVWILFLQSALNRLLGALVLRCTICNPFHIDRIVELGDGIRGNKLCILGFDASERMFRRVQVLVGGGPAHGQVLLVVKWVIYIFDRRIFPKCTLEVLPAKLHFTIALIILILNKQVRRLAVLRKRDFRRTYRASLSHNLIGTVLFLEGLTRFYRVDLDYVIVYDLFLC